MITTIVSGDGLPRNEPRSSTGFVFLWTKKEWLAQSQDPEQFQGFCVDNF